MKLNVRKNAILAGFLLTTIPIFAGAVEAPQYGGGVSDAEVFLGRLEPNRKIMPNPKRVEIQVAASQTAVPKANIKKARVDKVVFDSPDMEVDKLLQPAMTGKLNKKMSFEDMQKLATDATELLHSMGYGVSIVYIPQQEIIHNTLRMTARIGRYSDIKIVNTSSLKDKRVLDFIHGIRPGQLINSDNLEKSLLVLNDVFGLEARASLAPGNKPGTSSLNLTVRDLEKTGGYAYVDDYGNKSSGRWRYGLDYHINNVTHMGDQLDLGYLASTQSMRNYMVRYAIPMGDDGTIGRFVFSHMNYELGGKYSFLNGNGLANTFETGFTKPMHRTQTHSSFFDMAYRHRVLTDELLDDVIDSKKSSDSFQFEVHGYARMKKDSLSYSVSHTIGKLDLNSQQAKDQDTPLHTKGYYNKSNWMVYYIHQMNDHFQLHATMNGQVGWKNLDSSEDFYIAGADGVRAFPQGECGGDSGIIGTLELRYFTSIPGLQLTGFIDAGRVFTNTYHDGFYGENTRNLVGVGLGFIYNKYRDWYAKFDWATPLGNHYSTSEGNKVNNTYWFRLVKQF